MTALYFSRSRSLLSVLFAGLSIGVTAPQARSEAPVPPPISFTRQIRPILSDTCFACHGPDAKQRKAKLRLDTKATAFAELDSGDGHALVPSKPDESTLLKRISSTDPNMVMPPPKTGKKLTPEQVALVKKWIEEGAN